MSDWTRLFFFSDWIVFCFFFRTGPILMDRTVFVRPDQFFGLCCTGFVGPDPVGPVLSYRTRLIRPVLSDWPRPVCSDRFRSCPTNPVQFDKTGPVRSEKNPSHVRSDKTGPVRQNRTGQTKPVWFNKTGRVRSDIWQAFLCRTCAPIPAPVIVI